MSRRRLIAYSGLPGVGKSTASGYTAEKLSAPRYRSDEVRKELFETPTYSSEESEATYEELLSRARSELVGDRDVVVDATFGSRGDRERVAALAAETDAELAFVHVTCPAEIVRDRIAAREDVSDADFAVHLELRERFDAFERAHVSLDNAGTIDEIRELIDRDVL